MKLKKNEVPVRLTFDGLSRQQLLIYAHELGEHRRREHGLEHNLSQREQQMRELAASSIAAQEEEREWIALEVHDRIAQILASAFQQLQMLESMSHANPLIRQAAVRASLLVREAIRESRNIMNDLHPPVLDEFGIVPLIEEKLRHFQKDTRCRVSSEVDYPQRPPREVEMALYRIFHEALTNIGRHAPGVREVAVSLVYRDQTISLQVRDDGPGFDVEAALQARRVGGLMSMRRRAEIIGGEFDITSIPNQGTTVTLRVPVKSVKPVEVEKEGARR